MQNWKRERGGFARSCLGGSHKVGAVNNRRNGLKLNGGWRRVLLFVYGAEELGPKAE